MIGRKITDVGDVGSEVEDMTRADKTIEKANKQAGELEKKYNAPVVWMGGSKFIVVKDGKETMIQA